MDYYMHVFPGRIRIRTSFLRKEDDELHSVSRCVNAIQGVTSIKVNQSSGSVLICYDRKATTYHSILNKIAQQGLWPWASWKSKSIRFSTRAMPGVISRDA